MALCRSRLPKASDPDLLLLPHEGCSGVEEQTKLLTKVAQLLPTDTRVGAAGRPRIRKCGLVSISEPTRWSFVIRMKKDIWCRMANGRLFQIGEIPLRRGTINFEDNVACGLPYLRLSLNCGWSRLDPKDEPWYLLTPFRAGKHNLERYSRRFWIEERFDFKEQGFRLEKNIWRVANGWRCRCYAFASPTPGRCFWVCNSKPRANAARLTGRTGPS